MIALMRLQEPLTTHRRHRNRIEIEPKELGEDAPAELRGFYYEKFYKIDSVRIVAVWNDKTQPISELFTDHSANLLRFLDKVNLKHGKILKLEIDGQVPDAAFLWRFLDFIQTPGYSKGFRAWKIARKKSEQTFGPWVCNDGWRDLLKLLGFEKSKKLMNPILN